LTRDRFWSDPANPDLAVDLPENVAQAQDTHDAAFLKDQKGLMAPVAEMWITLF
jgi:hypothetical protein